MSFMVPVHFLISIVSLMNMRSGPVHQWRLKRTAMQIDAERHLCRAGKAYRI